MNHIVIKWSQRSLGDERGSSPKVKPVGVIGGEDQRFSSGGFPPDHSGESAAKSGELGLALRVVIPVSGVDVGCEVNSGRIESNMSTLNLE